jgi:hypothetical protein
LTKPEGGTAYGFVRARVLDETGTYTNLHTEAIAQPLETARTRVHAGAGYATESKLELQFITNGMLRVKDIVLEVAPGG